MERHILVYRPHIGSAYRVGKFIFHIYLVFVGFFNAARAENCADIGCVFLQNVMEFNIEIRDLLICGALGEREPVAGTLMIYAYLHSSEG